MSKLGEARFSDRDQLAHLFVACGCKLDPVPHVLSTQYRGS